MECPVCPGGVAVEGLTGGMFYRPRSRLSGGDNYNNNSVESTAVIDWTAPLSSITERTVPHLPQLRAEDSPVIQDMKESFSSVHTVTP